MKLLALALLLAGSPHPPSMTPRPIGVAPAYHPVAAPLHGRPVGRIRCTRAPTKRYGIHLEVFARRRVVIVPAGIGVAPPFVRRNAFVEPRGCTYPLRTLGPTGIVEVASGSRLTLSHLFRLWGQPLAARRVVGFRSSRPVLAFVGGRRWRRDPRAIPLRRHAQIVLEIDGYVPPHPRFLFPAGL